MKDTEAERPTKDLVLEYGLDAPPEKVWRAISIPAVRKEWLPQADLADPEPLSKAPGTEIRYTMRDTAPPFLESIVTFQVRPDANGGTILRIIQRLTDARAQARVPVPANANGPWMRLAA